MLTTGEIVVVIVGGRVSDEESDVCMCVLSGRYGVNIFADESRQMGKASWSCLFFPKENYCQGV